MLVDTIQYSGVTAKTKAMSKNLLSLEDYQTLSKCKKLKQFYDFMAGQLFYTEFLGNTELNSRKELEQMLSLSIYKGYKKIQLFIGKMEDKMLVNAILYPLKLEIMVEVFRNAVKGKEYLDYAKERLQDIPFNVEAFYEECRHKSWFHEPALKNMAFATVLENISGGKINLADLEMNLEVDIYLGMYRQMQKSNKYAAFRNYFGQEIDLLNFYKIYRFKKNFSLDPMLLYTKMIPVNTTLSREELRLFIETKDFMELKKTVEKTRWKNIFDAIQKNGFERTMFESRVARIKKELKLNDHSLFSVMAYFYRIQLERDNLMKIIESITYQLEDEKILETLFIWERRCLRD